MSWSFMINHHTLGTVRNLTTASGPLVRVGETEAQRGKRPAQGKPSPHLLAPDQVLCAGRCILIREGAVTSQGGVQFLDRNISQAPVWTPRQRVSAWQTVRTGFPRANKANSRAYESDLSSALPPED